VNPDQEVLPLEPPGPRVAAPAATADPDAARRAFDALADPDGGPDEFTWDPRVPSRTPPPGHDPLPPGGPPAG
jgi:hypothetical protein